MSVTETELRQADQLRQDFENWAIFLDNYGFTGRRRVNGISESYGPLPAAVVRSHLANAEVEDVHAEVRARSG